MRTLKAALLAAVVPALLLAGCGSSKGDDFEADGTACRQAQAVMDQMTAEMSDWRQNKTLSNDTAGNMFTLRRKLEGELASARTDVYRRILNESLAWAADARQAAANGSRTAPVASPQSVGIASGSFSGTCERLEILAAENS